MPMSTQTEVTGRTRRHVKNTINLTLRSKVNVVSGPRVYATHCVMVIHPCAKYGMPMSTKNIRARAGLHRQSDSHKPARKSSTGEGGGGG